MLQRQWPGCSGHGRGTMDRAQHDWASTDVAVPGLRPLGECGVLPAFGQDWCQPNHCAGSTFVPDLVRCVGGTPCTCTNSA